MRVEKGEGKEVKEEGGEGGEGGGGRRVKVKGGGEER